MDFYTWTDHQNRDQSLWPLRKAPVPQRDVCAQDKALQKVRRSSLSHGLAFQQAFHHSCIKTHFSDIQEFPEVDFLLRLPSSRVFAEHRKAVASTPSLTKAPKAKQGTNAEGADSAWSNRHDSICIIITGSTNISPIGACRVKLSFCPI